MLNHTDLPVHIDALKALLLASERRVQGRDERTLSAKNTRAAEIEHLKLRIARLRRMQFGPKSEKLDHRRRAVTGRPGAGGDRQARRDRLGSQMPRRLRAP